MVKATSGRADSTATFGELGAVEITTCSKVADSRHPTAKMPECGALSKA
jgi:hypothetical protein